MSVFVAIDLDEPVRTFVTSLVEAHQSAHAAKWIPPEKLHLTLVFLGNPDAQRRASLPTQLDALVGSRAPFELRLRGTGTFVTPRANSVLWLGVDGDLEALTHLQHEANGALGGDPRPWVPHLTLARGDQLDAVKHALADTTSPGFVVDHLTVYESTHHRYQQLSRHQFR